MLLGPAEDILDPSANASADLSPGMSGRAFFHCRLPGLAGFCLPALNGDVRRDPPAAWFLDILDIATRATGLGFNLNGSYLPADNPWWGGLEKAAADGASSDRVLEYWEAGRAKRDKFRCTLDTGPREGGGTLIDETCKRYFEPFEFVNRYWLKADASIECSRQWVHPKLDPLQFFGTEQQATTLDLIEDGC